MPRQPRKFSFFQIALAFALLLPLAAQAQYVPIAADGTVCPLPLDGAGNPIYMGITERVVFCITTVVRAATFSYLVGDAFGNPGIITWAASMIGIILTLATVFFGLRMFAGRVPRLQGSFTIFAIKVGAVIVVGLNFHIWYPVLLAAMDELVTMASSYLFISTTLDCPLALTVWQRLDCSMDHIIGGLSPATILGTGLVGFLVACLFSGPAGLSIFMVGIGFILMLLLAVFRAVYIYLSAYVGVSMLSALAPFFFPLLLFRATKAYFEKWVRIVLGMVLQPLLLFAYLSLLLAAFDVMVLSGPRSLYVTLAGPQAQLPGFQIGQYMLDNDAYVDVSAVNTNVSLDPRALTGGALDNTGFLTGVVEKISDKAEDINAFAQRTNTKVEVQLKGVDFSQLAALQGAPSTEEYVVRIVLAMITTLVVTYILNTLLNYIPYMSTMLTGGSLSGSGSIVGMPKLSSGFESLSNTVKGAFAPGRKA